MTGRREEVTSNGQVDEMIATTPGTMRRLFFLSFFDPTVRSGTVTLWWLCFCGRVGWFVVLVNHFSNPMGSPIKAVMRCSSCVLELMSSSRLAHPLLSRYLQTSSSRLAYGLPSVLTVPLTSARLSSHRLRHHCCPSLTDS